MIENTTMKREENGTIYIFVMTAENGIKTNALAIPKMKRDSMNTTTKIEMM
jgi:hypothetical protein